MNKQERTPNPMDARAADLITSLGLSPHPEGGHYRRFYRSASHVTPLDGRAKRAAVTSIYYLLRAGEASRWHRVGSDEIWHYCEGAPLELFTMLPSFDQIVRHVLGSIGDGAQPVHVVPAGVWQAARSTGPYTLSGCTVAPGFEYADFEMLRESPAEAEAASARHPGHADLV